jgi:sugar lactone lactonase YvrE
MRKIYVLLVIFWLVFQELICQPISPESIIWNEFTETYIISDTEEGKLLSLAGDGSYSLFTNGLEQPKGLAIGFFSLWVTDIDKLVEVDLLSGVVLNRYKIPEANSLNDVTTDGFGNLYVSDLKAGKIFKVNELTGTSEVFSKGTLNAPNGMYYDPLGGIIVVSFADPAKIYTIDTEEGNVMELMQTNLGQLDGITLDIKRNVYYISSWKTNSVYIFDPAFMDPPELLQGGFDGPADIFYNELTDTLAIPSMNSGEITFIGFGSTDVKDYQKYAFDIKKYPNPATDKMFFNTIIDSKTELRIYSLDGKMVLQKEIYTNSGINISSLNTGTYIFLLKNGKGNIKGSFIKE